MRRLLLILALAMTLVFIAGISVWADNTLKVGLDCYGQLTDSNGIAAGDINPTAKLAYEYTYHDMENNLDYGFGVSYQLDREIKSNTAAKYYFIPVYGVLHFNLTENEYVTAEVGYNFLDGNNVFKNGNSLFGGVYYAAGGGFNLNHLQVEILYSVNNGSRDSGTSTNVTNTQWSVNFGYRF